MSRSSTILIVALTLAAALPSRAIDVTIQYQTPTDTFFTADAQATLDKAAADVSYAITTNLSALNQSSYTGVNRDAPRPSIGVSSTPIPIPTSRTPTSRTSISRRRISRCRRSTRPRRSTLGQGRTRRGRDRVGRQAASSKADWNGAVDNLEAASIACPRCSVVGTFNGTLRKFDNGDGEPSYSLQYGFALGSLTFDDMTNWNFDYATLPTAGQNDFYSVAVHEMIHALGFGASQAWNTQVSGTDWSGPAVFDLLGTGTNVLSPGQDHIRSGLTGSPIIDGVYRSDLVQEAIMDPSLTVGTRKYITDLDLAFLEDMGWDVVAVPEPSTVVLLALAGLALLATVRRPPPTIHSSPITSH